MALQVLPLRAAETEVRIGVLYPLSGASAAGGEAVLAAVRAAQDIANNRHDTALPLAPGAGLQKLDGAKVRLVVADHGGDPKRGSAEAERLIVEEKVAALYGAYHSSVTEAASAVAERHGIPFVTGESSSPRLHRRGFKWFFRTGPHDGHYTKVMFDFLKDFQAKRGISFATVAILHEDTAFGVDSAAVQDDLAAAQGLVVVTKTAYRANADSLVAEVEDLKATLPDVLLPTSYAKDAILFVEDAKHLGYNPKIVIAQNAGYTDPTFLKAVGPAAEGIISRAPFALDMVDRIPLIRDMNEIYKKHSGGKEIFDPPARSFVGALVLMEAIDRAGATDPEAIRQALRETYIPASQIPMPWFDIEFGPDGQNTGVAAILAQYQDGRFYTVYPFRFAARPVIYPMPAWSAP
ncbi:MAG: ABC transporter substrate-binding protein [Alphaproteobacteria bacterium]|nr:ABC transporter substrate-binding protein [Alphaproteobacteria bacterium]